jgi:hypothetical protein
MKYFVTKELILLLVLQNLLHYANQCNKIKVLLDKHLSSILKYDFYTNLGLKMFSEILVLYPDNQTKHVHTLCNWRDREC